MMHVPLDMLYMVYESMMMEYVFRCLIFSNIFQIFKKLKKNLLIHDTVQSDALYKLRLDPNLNKITEHNIFYKAIA